MGNKYKLVTFFSRCRDGKTTETRIGMYPISAFHHCELVHNYLLHMYAVYRDTVPIPAFHNCELLHNYVLHVWNAGMGNTDTL